MSFSRILNAPPSIDPIEDESRRPLWSVMIPTYNCIHYLKETLESVLVQDTGAKNMQIEVVDDFSTDGDVEEMVKEIGKGRVTFYRQPENVGSLRNFESCIKRSCGHFIHLLHGDDQVRPGFYISIEQLFKTYPSAAAAITGLSAIDEKSRVLYPNNDIQPNEGIIENWLLRIARNQCIQACAIVVKRTVYEKLGGFFAVHYGEDWEMWTRIAAHYPVAYTPKNLAFYRLHNNNISTRYLSSGQNIKDIETVIEIIQGYLPPDKKRIIKKIAKKNYSIYFTGSGPKNLQGAQEG
jgi:glycosyltransferase involved in cell wall biosynthesis